MLYKLNLDPKKYLSHQIAEYRESLGFAVVQAGREGKVCRPGISRRNPM